MTDSRFVVAGLAHVRSPWFTEVARWATAGTLPIEFVKCVSPAELRARTSSGRPFSAALLDARLAAVDRDLIGALRARSITPLVVDAEPHRADWAAIEVAAVLDPSFTRTHLIDALVANAPAIDAISSDADAAELASTPRPDVLDRCPLIAVVGRSGAGTSTVAIALAQALADQRQTDSPVILADLALYAHQALLHDAGDIVPGIQELVDAHRTGVPDTSQIHDLTYRVPGRGYRLLLGLRRHRDWVGVRPRSLRTAIDGLRSAAEVVVADVSGDLEGESDTGSFDIEDRNLLARTAVTQADVVVAVAQPTATGIHGLVVLLADLRRAGVGPERTVVVVNRAPLRPRRRAELVRTIADLVDAPRGEPTHRGPLFVPDRRGVDELHLSVHRFPTTLTSSLGMHVQAVLDDLGPKGDVDPDLEPVAVVPGELGRAG